MKSVLFSSVHFGIDLAKHPSLLVIKSVYFCPSVVSLSAVMSTSSDGELDAGRVRVIELGSTLKMAWANMATESNSSQHFVLHMLDAEFQKQVLGSCVSVFPRVLVVFF